jgi:hypothetical protein
LQSDLALAAEPLGRRAQRLRGLLRRHRRGGPQRRRFERRELHLLPLRVEAVESAGASRKVLSAGRTAISQTTRITTATAAATISWRSCGARDCQNWPA